MSRSFTVRVGVIPIEVTAPDAQRAAVRAAEDVGMRQDVLCTVIDGDGWETRWTVRYVEYRYARPA